MAVGVVAVEKKKKERQKKAQDEMKNLSHSQISHFLTFHVWCVEKDWIRCGTLLGLHAPH
jgi:hypothetical protein